MCAAKGIVMRASATVSVSSPVAVRFLVLERSSGSTYYVDTTWLVLETYDVRIIDAPVFTSLDTVDLLHLQVQSSRYTLYAS